MKFTKATNYALHTMLMLIEASTVKPVGVQQLAESQGVSPTYLSKILTRLVKAGMIESISGANGGYRLTRHRDDITFLDIIHAIEGSTSLFECNFVHGEECLIQAVMKEAEEKMENHLKNKKLVDIAQQLHKKSHS
ncbi:Rrf2 family transcriptional regulator [Paenibacillus sp. E194]|jgi:Rrf2 family protein|uniref:RrF2 family transcriptional regulator n=1 Tax=Paenibacillus alvei TaxID=44250 RepID=A0ABT4E9A2_PAEAL|nr:MULTISPECIES: RrF2 family transcriptional regulator [Paenibacillus]KJB89041.1 Rrf2 family transcriptional regulator [Paenibacillus sp. E194]MCM3293210.1 RrF2 family transcriptional regulator [Paenibacillus sp. MER 180]MCY9530317.1 RrF2 family transcriptional regulator [Paenibacillus alvei]SDF69505.1 Rrf2 family protein [Paenibacillus sp. cl6col]